MCKLDKKIAVDKRIPKYCYIRYSPAEASKIKTPNSKKCNNIPKENSVLSLLNSYLQLKFEVIKIADISGSANEDDIWLVILVPISLFPNFKLTTSSGKHLEDISHAHIVFLEYKIISGAKDRDDLTIGFV